MSREQTPGLALHLHAWLSHDTFFQIRRTKRVKVNREFDDFLRRITTCQRDSNLYGGRSKLCPCGFHPAEAVPNPYGTESTHRQRWIMPTQIRLRVSMRVLPQAAGPSAQPAEGELAFKYPSPTHAYSQLINKQTNTNNKA